jgi:hypothetical protein
MFFNVNAQDSLERLYGFEILQPRHEPKSKVSGFAQLRIEEKMNRGLMAAKTADGKAVHIRWRLLKSDAANVGFNVFRYENGKGKKLNGKPITATTDFIDTKPVA